jgi:hypothetical protein
MAKVIMKVAGIDGQIFLLTDRVVITRDGLLNVFTFGFNSRREIPLAAISEVMFRGASMFKPGHIEFVRSGRSQDERKSAKQSTVKFRKIHGEKFEELKEKIFELMEKNSRSRAQ